MINNTYVMNNTLILQAFEHLLPLTEGNLVSWLEITEGECFRRVWEVWEGVGHLNVAGTSPCKGVKCLRSLVAQKRADFLLREVRTMCLRVGPSCLGVFPGFKFRV